MTDITREDGLNGTNTCLSPAECTATDAATLQRQLEDVGEELDAQEKEITHLRHALDKAEWDLAVETQADHPLRVKLERERDEALEVLRDVANMDPFAANRARAILAKHELKP